MSVIPAAMLLGLHEHPPLLEASIWRTWPIGNGLICISVTNEIGHHFHIYTSQNRDPRTHPENLTDGRLVIDYKLKQPIFPLENT